MRIRDLAWMQVKVSVLVVFIRKYFFLHKNTQKHANQKRKKKYATKIRQECGRSKTQTQTHTDITFLSIPLHCSAFRLFDKCAKRVKYSDTQKKKAEVDRGQMECLSWRMHT